MEKNEALYIFGAVFLVAAIGFLALGFDNPNISGDAIITNRCSDSDGGRSYYAKGTVVVSGSAPSTNSDSCVGTMKLKEYFCTSNKMRSSTLYTCPNGCANGACKR